MNHILISYSLVTLIMNLNAIVRCCVYFVLSSKEEYGETVIRQELLYM